MVKRPGLDARASVFCCGPSLGSFQTEFAPRGLKILPSCRRRSLEPSLAWRRRPAAYFIQAASSGRHGRHGGKAPHARSAAVPRVREKSFPRFHIFCFKFFLQDFFFVFTSGA